jgi:hypothetical protein
MLPAMSEKELDLFFAFLKNSRNYLEFGTGGSTYAASRHVKQSIISVDSSAEWLDKLRVECANSEIDQKLIYIDIGPVGDWGYPTELSSQPKWPRYHEYVWELPESSQADLYLVDGRFRVACFAQTVIHCRPDALIGFHDFASRKQYHSVYEIAREVATAEDMSFFLPLPDVREKAMKIVEEYKFNMA